MKRYGFKRRLLIAAAVVFSAFAFTRTEHSHARSRRTAPWYDSSVDPAKYNCAGLAFQNYRTMSHDEMKRALSGFHRLAPGETPEPGVIKFWYWEYDTYRLTDAGAEQPHRDYHVVSGRTSLGGSDPRLVYSKNGLRAVVGPAPPAQMRPRAWEVLGLNRFGRNVIQVRYNMTETCYTAKPSQLPK